MSWSNGRMNSPRSSSSKLKTIWVECGGLFLEFVEGFERTPKVL